MQTSVTFFFFFFINRAVAAGEIGILPNSFKLSWMHRLLVHSCYVNFSQTYVKKEHQFVTSDIHLIDMISIRKINSLHYAACHCKAFRFCMQKPFTGDEVNKVAAVFKQKFITRTISTGVYSSFEVQLLQIDLVRPVLCVNIYHTPHINNAFLNE